MMCNTKLERQAGAAGRSGSRERRAGAAGGATMQALVVVHYPALVTELNMAPASVFRAELCSLRPSMLPASLCPYVACVAGSSFRCPDRRFPFDCDTITCMPKVRWTGSSWDRWFRQGQGRRASPGKLSAPHACCAACTSRCS